MTDQFAEFAKLEENGWNNSEIVDAYVNRFAPVTNAIAPLMVEIAGGREKHVLDLCCGQGFLTKLLVENGGTIIGLDFSAAMLEVAKKSVSNAEFHCGDAAKMPFENNSFDSVACNFGLMHLPDRQAALSEVTRVLKPGGKFVMSTWVGPADSPAFGTVFGAIKSHADFSMAPEQPDLFGIAEPDVIESIFSKVGLKLSTHRIEEPAWVLKHPDELFETFLTATVGARMLIRSQTNETVTAIHEQITSTVSERFKNGDGYRVAAPVSIIVAEKS